MGRRKRIHGKRRRRSPIKFTMAPIGEEQSNYDPQQQDIQMKLRMQEEMERSDRERKSAQESIRRQQQQQRQTMNQLQQMQQQRGEGGGDGAHTHEASDFNLGGLIQSTGKGAQSPSPFYHRRK
tara:strand:+ start:205 stop:576 length:372 start_codon:yes stop_codon:yes gene_type:complete